MDELQARDVGLDILKQLMPGWDAGDSYQKWWELQRPQAYLQAQRQGMLVEEGPTLLGAALERGTFHQSVRVSFFSQCCDKIQGINNLQEKEFIWGHSSQSWFNMVGNSF